MTVIRFHRQVYGKNGSLSHGTLDGYGSPVAFDDVFGDGQTQSGATLFPGSGFVHSIEALKDARQMFFGDADTAILDTDGQIIGIGQERVIFRNRGDPLGSWKSDLCTPNNVSLKLHLSPFRGVFYGVVQEIEEGLNDAVFFPIGPGFLRDALPILLVSDPFLPGRVLDHLTGGSQDGSDRDRFSIDPLLSSSFQSGQFQEIADESVHLLDIFFE